MKNSFKPILKRARARHGDALEGRFSQVLDPKALAGVPDDRVLSSMAKCVFAAGFRWRVVQAKWPTFEEAFLGFNPAKIAAFDQMHLDALAADTRIIRNPQKIRATVENARFVREVGKEHGGFAAFLAAWPDDDVVGLWAYLKKHGSRLGGNTGPRTLRLVGKDTFIVTGDVEYALRELGIIRTKSVGKAALKAAQSQFAAWSKEMGMPMAHLSVALACSVERPTEADADED